MLTGITSLGDDKGFYEAGYNAKQQHHNLLRHNYAILPKLNAIHFGDIASILCALIILTHPKPM